MSCQCCGEPLNLADRDHMRRVGNRIYREMRADYHDFQALVQRFCRACLVAGRVGERRLTRILGVRPVAPVTEVAA